MPHPQDLVKEGSSQDRNHFWAHQAQQLHWHRQPTETLVITKAKVDSGASHPSWSWFPDGHISTCYNCVDRHVLAGRGDSPAIIWDSPVTGSKEVYSYKRLLDEVSILAGVLRQQGVACGDVVLVYMPMIPASLIALLAISRLGAVHAVVFGGFSAPSLAQRIDASKPKALMTASCGIEGTKGAFSYQELVRGAIRQASHKPDRTIIWQRETLRWDSLIPPEGERCWQDLIAVAKAQGVQADCVPIPSTSPLYIIYTSGTTGNPKGVVRSAGGHAVGLNYSAHQTFGLTASSVIFCASDIGWVVGHSYILYAPLLTGATTVLLEGKPVGTPDAGTFWRILQEHRVNVLFTAPTALRAIRRDDPSLTLFTEAASDDGLRSLKALFLAGERSEPALIEIFQALLTAYAAPGALVVDNWWSTEAGSPVTSIALEPSWNHLAPTASQKTAPLPPKPGTAGKPLPGWDVHVVDDNGTELPAGSMGNIVLGLPLAPTGFTTLWRDTQRFYNSYLARFNGRWLDTGDAGMLSPDGYLSVLARSDDVLNVAAHRLSTGALEQVVATVPGVMECAVVGVPDRLKGQRPLAFVGLAEGFEEEEVFQAVQRGIRAEIGGIAALGGMVVGGGMIPKTRSGKTLRRVLRELVENAVRGRFEKEVAVPATVEDRGVVDVARERVRAYFEIGKGRELRWDGGKDSKL
ncbi:MAG: Acyl-CoA synthetase short-chain member 3, mitochondrial [Vezdaea aestivalis]|nr:MAG: Acyl-CoA synthetase short-chain member 3, mitochondrial [Vezdaea aestivalis]